MESDLGLALSRKWMKYSASVTIRDKVEIWKLNASKSWLILKFILKNYKPKHFKHSLKQRDIKMTHCPSTRAYIVIIARLDRTVIQ